MTRGRLAAAIADLQHDRLDAAERRLRAVLSDEPQQPDALHLLGMWHHARGDRAAAEESIRAAIAHWPEHDPRLALPWNNLGNVLVESGRSDDALGAYERASEAAPDSPAPWVNRANLLRRLGRLAEAEPAARTTVELRPQDPEAWFCLARILIERGKVPDGLQANARGVALAPAGTVGRDQVLRSLVLLGRHDEAAALYREWLVEQPDDPVARHQLAAVGGAAPPSRAADAYVATVFDGFADSFDVKLASLGYRAPHLVVAALGAHTLGDVADLGCGTGLVGAHLDRPRSLTGVDLSEGMLDHARRRGGYDRLLCLELVAFLRDEVGSFDTIVSADTLCYIGDLAEFASAAHAALRPGGVLAFTVEALAPEAGDWALNPTGRYAHSPAYIHAAFGGFSKLGVEHEVLRSEGGRPVDGLVVRADR